MLSGAGVLAELQDILVATAVALEPGWDERYVATRRLVLSAPALLAYVEHYRAGIERQVIACLADKLDMDSGDLRLHVLSELTTTAWSVSGRDWVRRGGQGGRRALIEGLEDAFRAIPASLDLSASQAVSDRPSIP
ncbi:MAG: dehydrogenase [Actinomycetia bacterium]|nr:dehydrogenase [Actinomycetes bacterium]